MDWYTFLLGFELGGVFAIAVIVIVDKWVEPKSKSSNDRSPSDD